MNMSATNNFIKTASTLQKHNFNNELSSTRKTSHKLLNQSRRLARHNKSALHCAAYNANKEGV